MPSIDNNILQIAQTTTQKYLRETIDNTIRERLYLSMLRKRGKITEGHDGKFLEQKIEFNRPPIQTRTDMQQITYTAKDRWRTIQLPWRQYSVNDAMGEMASYQNSGVPAIVKVFDGMAERLKKDMDEGLGPELYRDGYAGDGSGLCGIDSFTGTGAVAAGDQIAQPSDTYAEVSTAVAAEGGSWTTTAGTTAPNSTIGTDWPNGSGTASYDWFSPKLLNWSSTNWGTSGATTWEANCERVLRQGKHWCTATGGSKGTINLVLMDSAMFTTFANKQSSKQNIFVPHKEAEDLGFPDVLNFEGMAIHYEFGCPVNSVYGHNLMNEEICVLGKNMYKSHGPIWDEKTASYLWLCLFMGNMKFNPKLTFKAKNYA